MARKKLGKVMRLKPLPFRPFPNCCVPYAIAAWTGTSPEAIIDAEGIDVARFNEVGVWDGEVYNMMARLRPPPEEYCPSLNKLLRHIPANARGFAWVFNSHSQHLIAFDGWQVACAVFPGRLVWLHDHPMRFWRLKRLFLITREEKP